MIETKTAKKVKIPCQKKLHRKQCLLSQDAEEDQDSTPIDEGMVSFDLYFLLSKNIASIHNSKSVVYIYFQFQMMLVSSLYDVLMTPQEQKKGG